MTKTIKYYFIMKFKFIGININVTPIKLSLHLIQVLLERKLNINV